jgi:hypothetical protein
MLRLALLVVLSVTALAETASSHAADIEVLVASGQRDNDGYALHGFAGLTGGPRSITFQASTDAIVQIGSDGARVLVRSGDLLPAPLTGTFNALGLSAVSDSGAVFFSALADSPDIARGVYRLDEHGLAQVRANVGTSSNLAVNRGGDVVLQTTRRLRVLHADGTLVPSQQKRTRGRFPAPAVINDDGVVAFVEDVLNRSFSVIRWRPDVDLGEPVHTESVGRRARKLARGHVSINAHADVAFFATAGSGVGVFMAPGDGLPTVQVAAEGDRLGAGTLESISPDFVGIDDSRSVVFLETLPDGRRQLVVADGGTLATLGDPLDPGATQFAPRLTASGAVAWVSGGAPWRLDGRVATRLDPQRRNGLGTGFVASGTSLAADGTVVATLSRHAIFRHGAPLRSVVATGDVIPGAGPIVGIGGHASHDESTAFLATVEDGRQILALASPSGPRRLAMAGDPVRGGQTLGTLDGPFDWDGRRAAATEDASQAVVLVSPDGSLDLLAASGDRSPGGAYFLFFGSPIVVRQGVVVPASVDSRAGQGLFLLRDRRAHVIVGPGSRAPASGGKVFVDFQTVRRMGPGVAFVATLQGDDAATELAVFSWEPHVGIRRLDARAHRQGLTLDGPVATQGTTLIALGYTDREQGIFLLGRYRPRLLLRDGDTSPLGGSIAIPLDTGLVPLHDRAVFVATLESGARSSEAILAVGEDRGDGPS